MKQSTEAGTTSTVSIHHPNALLGLAVAGYVCEVVESLGGFVLRAKHAPDIELADALSRDALESFALRSGLFLGAIVDGSSTIECPKCGHGDIGYENDARLAFSCDGCGSRFEVEEDADFDGESYTDESAPGAEIVK